MARNYIVGGKNITVAGATTLVHINPATGRAFRVIRMWVSQIANATSAQVAIEWGQKASVFPTLTSVTPALVNLSDPASKITGGTAGAAGTAGINASAEGAGTATPIYTDAFNALQGWLWTPSMNYGEAPVFSSADSQAFYLKFSAAPATLTGWNFGAEYEELG